MSSGRAKPKRQSLIRWHVRTWAFADCSPEISPSTPHRRRLVLPHYMEWILHSPWLAVHFSCGSEWEKTNLAESWSERKPSKKLSLLSTRKVCSSLWWPRMALWDGGQGRPVFSQVSWPWHAFTFLKCSLKCTVGWLLFLCQLINF